MTKARRKSMAPPKPSVARALASPLAVRSRSSSKNRSSSSKKDTLQRDPSSERSSSVKWPAEVDVALLRSLDRQFAAAGGHRPTYAAAIAAEMTTSHVLAGYDSRALRERIKALRKYYTRKEHLVSKEEGGASAYFVDEQRRLIYTLSEKIWGRARKEEAECPEDVGGSGSGGDEEDVDAAEGEEQESEHEEGGSGHDDGGDEEEGIDAAEDEDQEAEGEEDEELGEGSGNKEDANNDDDEELGEGGGNKEDANNDGGDSKNNERHSKEVPEEAGCNVASDGANFSEKYVHLLDFVERSMKMHPSLDMKGFWRTLESFTEEEARVFNEESKAALKLELQHAISSQKLILTILETALKKLGP